MTASLELNLAVPAPQVGAAAAGGVVLGSLALVAELLAREVSATAGAGVFAAVLLVLVNAAAVRAYRAEDAADPVVRLLLVIALVPLARLLVLSAPLVPALRVDPRGVWAVPLAVAAGIGLWGLVPQAARLPVLSRGLGVRQLVVLIAVGLTGLPLGLAAYQLGTDVPGSVAFRARPMVWVGVVLIAVVAVAEELVVRGVVQPLAHEGLGGAGLLVTAVVSSYLWTAWLGLSAALPVVVASLLFTWSAHRYGCLYGGLLGRVLMLVSLVTLWPSVLE